MTAPDFRQVDQHTGDVAFGAEIPEAGRPWLAELLIEELTGELHRWRTRAGELLAERDVARARIEEIAVECREWAQGFARAHAELAALKEEMARYPRALDGLQTGGEK
jgi:hypothetical protein